MNNDCKKGQLSKGTDKEKYFADSQINDMILEPADEDFRDASDVGLILDGEPLDKKEDETGALDYKEINTLTEKLLQEHPEFAQDVAALLVEFTDEDLKSFIEDNADTYIGEEEIEVDEYLGTFDSTSVDEIEVTLDNFYITDDNRLALDFTIVKTGEIIAYDLGYSKPMYGSSAWYEPDDPNEREITVSATFTGRIEFPHTISNISEYNIVVDEDSKEIEVI